MVTRIEGTPQQIQSALAQAVANQAPHMGDHGTAILILEPTPIIPTAPSDKEFERLMAEADQDAVSVGHVDDSREAIYTRMDGE